MKKTEKKNCPKKENEQIALDLNDLNQVTGSGDPFADIPRVPEQEIDPELRNNG